MPEHLIVTVPEGARGSHTRQPAYGDPVTVLLLDVDAFREAMASGPPPDRDDEQAS